MDTQSKSHEQILSLVDFFGLVQSEPYCVIKPDSELPRYEPGQDIDIFCYDVDKIAQIIVKWARPLLPSECSIQIIADQNHDQVYVDIIREHKIYLRFDLYGRLPNYRKLKIKPALFESVIENAVGRDIDHTDGGCHIKVPSVVDDMVLRYIEFAEWYDMKPRKIKHLDYVMEHLDAVSGKVFWDKLHHYTAMPDYPDVQPAHRGQWKEFFARYYRQCQGKTFPQIVAGFFRKLSRQPGKLYRAVKSRYGNHK